MRIAEVVGFYPDQELEYRAPAADVMQRLAAAFTRSGRVKGHWDLQGLGGEPRTPLPHVCPMSASSEVIPTVPTADAAPNTGISLVSTGAEVPPLDDVVVQRRPVLAPFRR
jgi:hypothetical protein